LKRTYQEGRIPLRRWPARSFVTIPYTRILSLLYHAAKRASKPTRRTHSDPRNRRLPQHIRSITGTQARFATIFAPPLGLSRCACGFNSLRISGGACPGTKQVQKETREAASRRLDRARPPIPVAQRQPVASPPSTGGCRQGFWMFVENKGSDWVCLVILGSGSVWIWRAANLGLGSPLGTPLWAARAG
jgi:hypothetical protein